MSHVSLKRILDKARREKYGVPCLLAGNLEMILGAVKAAEHVQSPLILAYNASVTPDVPMELVVPLMAAASEKAKIPVATILDHGNSFDAIVKAMNLGLSSIMFDGSGYTYEENIENTQEIVKIAHALGVSVEAELGSVGGSVLETGASSGSGSVFTDPDKVAGFVEKTGVDALAISFGNVHGRYIGQPNLDMDRLRKIFSNVDIPLVMHGASGLKENDYRTVISNGISKVNYYTAIGRGAVDNIKSLVCSDSSCEACHQLISNNIEYIYRETKKLMDLFGCSGKAFNDGVEAGTKDGELAQKIARSVYEVFKKLDMDIKQ